MNFIAIDFETANFKRQSVCSVGLAIVENFEVVKTINKLIKPIPNYYENINMSIHGISPKMTESQPTFGVLWNEIKPYIDSHKLVAHNASFDFSALRYVLDAYHIDYPSLYYYCSMQLSKRVFPGLVNYQLPTICKYLGISNLIHHDAESDALACANVMIEICKSQNADSLDNLEQVLGFSKGEIYPNSYSPFKCYNGNSTKSKNLFDFVPDNKNFDVEHPFYQKRVVFTGALSKLSRNDAKQVVANIGGIIKPENLSSKTNYLIVGTYDYNKYGEGYKSSKLKKAEELIAQGKELEIISETDFFKMVHSDSASFEIKVDQIIDDSDAFLKRNKYNEFSNKKVFFSSNLSVNRSTAFQHVGYCSGYGHDYDTEEIPTSDFFVISDKLIKDLKKGVKNKSIIDFERLRNEAQNRGNLSSVKLLSESTFLKYIEKRDKFQKGEMAIHEWEIGK